jgi:hypothetical protein
MESSEISIPALPSDAMQDRSISAHLLLFAGKALIAAIIFVASILIIAVHIENKVSRFAQEAQKATKIGGSEFWKKIEQEIDRAGDPDQAISPEKKQKILGELRLITAQWKPFLTEAYSIVTAPPNEPAAVVPVK